LKGRDKGKWARKHGVEKVFTGKKQREHRKKTPKISQGEQEKGERKSITLRENKEMKKKSKTRRGERKGGRKSGEKKQEGK